MRAGATPRPAAAARGGGARRRPRAAALARGLLGGRPPAERQDLGADESQPPSPQTGIGTGASSRAGNKRRARPCLVKAAAHRLSLPQIMSAVLGTVFQLRKDPGHRRRRRCARARDSPRRGPYLHASCPILCVIRPCLDLNFILPDRELSQTSLP